MKERILQANLNNLGGAFSVAYEAQKKLADEYVFDYFFPDAFVKNAVYLRKLIVAYNITRIIIGNSSICYFIS